MRFLGLSGGSWMMVVAVAIGLSLGKGVAKFFAALPLNFLTFLSRLLLRRFPDSRLKSFFLLWLD